MHRVVGLDEVRGRLCLIEGGDDVSPTNTGCQVSLRGVVELRFSGACVGCTSHEEALQDKELLAPSIRCDLHVILNPIFYSSVVPRMQVSVLRSNPRPYSDPDSPRGEP